MSWRRFNLGLVIVSCLLWAAAAATGLVYSVAFVAHISMGYGVVACIAAWRTDVPNDERTRGTVPSDVPHGNSPEQEKMEAAGIEPACHSSQNTWISRDFLARIRIGAFEIEVQCDRHHSWLTARHLSAPEVLVSTEPLDGESVDKLEFLLAAAQQLLPAEEDY